MYRKVNYPGTFTPGGTGVIPLPTVTRQRRFSPVVVVLLAIICLLYSALLQAQENQSQSEQTLLRSLTAFLNLPPEAAKEDILHRVADGAIEQNEAGKARIAKLVGLYAGWDAIFERIKKMHGAQRDLVLQTIAQEFQVQPTISLNSLRNALQQRQRALPMIQSQRIPTSHPSSEEPVRSSVMQIAN